MATILPGALNRVYGLIDPHYRSMKPGGIVNPRRPGYHTSREDLIAQGRGGDYSIQCPADRRGNPKYAAGIDITFEDLAELVTMHKLLRAAVTPDASGSYDPRIECVREFIGTLDGRVVSGYNRVATGTASRSRVGWVASGFGDSSHLWHEHISVLRDRVDNDNDMRGLAEVLTGQPRGAFGWTAEPEHVPPTPPTPPVPPTPPKKETPVVRVTSTNMQDDTLASSRAHPWSARRAGYIAAVRSTRPDVVLVQEATKGQMADLCAGLGETWTWWRAEDTARDDGPIAVAWNMAVLERTDVREIELPSNRRGLAVQLRHEKSGRRFWAVCSHLDNGAAQATVRVAQATKLAEWLPDGDLVFGADLNDKRTGGTGPRAVLRKAGLRFIRDQVRVAGSEWESHHGYGTLTRDGKWISDMATRGVKVTEGALIRTDRDAPIKAHRNVSDHNMLRLVAEL